MIILGNSLIVKRFSRQSVELGEPLANNSKEGIGGSAIASPEFLVYNSKLKGAPMVITIKRNDELEKLWENFTKIEQIEKVTFPHPLDEESSEDND